MNTENCMETLPGHERRRRIKQFLAQIGNEGYLSSQSSENHINREKRERTQITSYNMSKSAD